MGNTAEYVPDPEEIKSRIRIMRAMESWGWDDDFIVSCMVHDHPTPETVERLVDAYGHKEAYRRMIRMTQPISFDVMHMVARRQW